MTPRNSVAFALAGENVTGQPARRATLDRCSRRKTALDDAQVTTRTTAYATPAQYVGAGHET